MNISRYFSRTAAALLISTLAACAVAAAGRRFLLVLSLLAGVAATARAHRP